MSVSSTRVRTRTRPRSAMRNSNVPPPTSWVGDEMTCPGSTLRSMMVPSIGASTSVSSSAMWAFSTSTRARTSCASASESASAVSSNSLSVMVLSATSLSARSICNLAMDWRDSAAFSAASAWARLLVGMRLSIRTSRAERSTGSPFSALIASISPEALDFSSTVRSGSTAPAASTNTRMSRSSTGAWS